MRLATVTKSAALVWILLITAASESAVLSGLAIILCKSTDNSVRPAIIVKSEDKTYMLLTTALSDTALRLI